MRPRQSDPGLRLRQILEKVRSLAEEVRFTAERVHQKTEEARRLAVMAHDQLERGRELSKSSRREADQMRGSLEKSLLEIRDNGSPDTRDAD
jgi:hypothetical protein